jgi:hypothetical protein
VKKLLDVTDRRTRLLQFALMGGSGVLVAMGVSLLRVDRFPMAFAIAMMVGAGLLFVVTAGIKQRWEIEYRGHRVRFENSPVFGERLFLDAGLVAKGGVGMKMEMRAPIRVGEGAGEVIVALVDAGLRDFRLRLFVEAPEGASEHEATPIEPREPESSRSERARAFAEAAEDLRPVTQNAVLGTLILAKNVYETIASVVGLIGGVSALVAWLL